MSNTLVSKIPITAGGVTPAIDISGTPAGGLAVQALDGTPAFVGTVQLEGSVDGTNFDNLGAVVADQAVAQIAGVHKFIRANCTAFTSGVLIIHVAMQQP